jgi:hypothetical protein
VANSRKVARTRTVYLQYYGPHTPDKTDKIFIALDRGNFLDELRKNEASSDLERKVIEGVLAKVFWPLWKETFLSISFSRAFFLSGTENQKTANGPVLLEKQLQTGIRAHGFFLVHRIKIMQSDSFFDFAVANGVKERSLYIMCIF